MTTALTSPLFHVLDFGGVRVRVQLSSFTAEQFEQHLRQEAEAVRREIAEHQGERIFKTVIVNHPNVEMRADARIRKAQADWLEENEDLLRLTCEAMGFVVEGALLRGMITAVFWLTHTPIPYTTHGSLEAALDWAIHRATVSPECAAPSEEILQDRVAAVERALAAHPATATG